MTQPSPPTRPQADRQLARDVARHIDRRRMRRRLMRWTALLILVAVAALYVRFGGGFGLGFGGGGFGDGRRGTGTSRAVAAPQRCAIRVSPDGIAIGSRAVSRDEAVAACRPAPGVDIHPTGDARHGDVEELRTALEAAGAKDVVVVPPPKASQAPGAPQR